MTDEPTALHGAKTVGDCRVCGHTLVPRATWYKLTPEQRRDLMDAGYMRSQARQLCVTDYEYARTRGTLEDHERLMRTQEWLVEDFEHIRDTLPLDASRAERLRRAGERLGMTPNSLDVALRRAGVAA